jgi:integrase/recombinase XerD
VTIRTFLLFIYGTGARVYEAINLRVSDINFQNKIVSLRRPEGEHRRILPIDRTLRNTLDVYLQSSVQQGGGTDLVFVTRDDGRLRRNTVRYNVVRICAAGAYSSGAQLQLDTWTHDFRHTFAVHVLETWVRQGEDLQQKLPVLSGYMGHALLTSTELYLRLVLTDL